MDPANTAATYAFTIPVFIRTLENVAKMLVKAEQHARRHKIEPATLLSARLYPDMFTLLQQVQYVCFVPVDFAKHFSAAPAPRVGYDETSFADLEDEHQADHWIPAAHQAEAVRSTRGKRLCRSFSIRREGSRRKRTQVASTVPDFFFHVTVAYAILRHSGVPLGKADFLGPLGAVPIRKRKP